MALSYSIHYLADHPDYIDLVGTWVWEEWDKDNGWTREQCINLLRNEGCRKNSLDVTLIALSNEKCIGTIQLMKDDFLENFKHLSPWIGSFYVSPAFRKGRIAMDLCNSMEKICGQLGFSHYYAHTTKLQKFFNRRRGEYIGESVYSGKKVDVYKLPVPLE